MKHFTANSLALIDEAFSSTSVTEAVPIAANFIHELCRRGAKCIFVTHLHELCETQPLLAACGEKIGYLHTEENGDRCSYMIQNGKAKPDSCAQRIARKYGLMK